MEVLSWQNHPNLRIFQQAMFDYYPKNYIERIIPVDHEQSWKLVSLLEANTVCLWFDHVIRCNLTIFYVFTFGSDTDDYVWIYVVESVSCVSLMNAGPWRCRWLFQSVWWGIFMFTCLQHLEVCSLCNFIQHPADDWGSGFLHHAPGWC